MAVPSIGENFEVYTKQDVLPVQARQHSPRRTRRKSFTGLQRYLYWNVEVISADGGSIGVLVSK
jgi:hypothetical protein